MYIVINLVLCSVVNSQQTEWVKLPQIGFQDRIQPKTSDELHVIKFTFDNKTTVFNNVTKDNFSYLDNFSHMFTTNNKKRIMKNYTITTDIDIVTLRAPTKINTKPKLTQIINFNTPSVNFSKLEGVQHVLENINKSKNVKPNLNNQNDNNNTDDQTTNDYLHVNNFANIIAAIQQNIFINIPKTLNRKLKFLKNIRNSILNYLDEQIGALWTKSKRQKRGAKGDDNHLDFPSSETALMTIGFLTFSVFLIKLVMQLIYVLKAKKMMSFTPMTAVGRSYDETVKDPGKRDKDTIRILKLMEDFQYN